MGMVSKNQIEQARQVDVLDYVLNFERDNIKRVGGAYRMIDHPSIEIKRSKWRWYSRGLYGKTALDYLINVRGYRFADAVSLLTRENEVRIAKIFQPGNNISVITGNHKNLNTGEPEQGHHCSPPDYHKIVIPRRNVNNDRVTAYLQSRGIDRDVVLDCIGRGDLYESAYFHDCVFIGRDENGKSKYAAVRSTTSGYKGDAAGSSKEYCFAVPPGNPDSHMAAVYEAPVDLLSHISMCNHGFIPDFDGWRLSLGGTSVLGLSHFLNRNPQITHCLACTDADEAGDMAAARIKEFHGITVERSPPVHGKDWNDALTATLRAENSRLRAYKKQPQRAAGRALA